MGDCVWDGVMVAALARVTIRNPPAVALAASGEGTLASLQGMLPERVPWSVEQLLRWPGCDQRNMGWSNLENRSSDTSYPTYPHSSSLIESLDTLPKTKPPLHEASQISKSSSRSAHALSPPDKLNFGIQPYCVLHPEQIPAQATPSPGPSGQQPPSSHSSYVIMLHVSDAHARLDSRICADAQLHPILEPSGQEFAVQLHTRTLTFGEESSSLNVWRQAFVDEFMLPPPI
ncbi:hypothetical protein BJV78DRAFT_1156080 [Lactifluus subvellereus]|nr:hypothetical protein BJV78DRAFT_1156080 [Lactifluus subvellereus]